MTAGPAALSGVTAGSVCRGLGGLRGKLRRLAGVGFVGGALVVAVACGAAGERRISTSCREEGGGAAGVPPGNCTSLFGLSATVFIHCWKKVGIPRV